MKKIPAIFFGVMLLAAVPLLFAPKAVGAPLVINAYNYDQEVAQSTVPVLIEFSAKWCPYCRKMRPIVDKLQGMGAYGMKVVQIDIDAEPYMASQYTVEMLPTLVVVHNNKMIARHDGAMKEEDLFGWIKGIMTAATP